ncbi:anti-sigma factor family protein [Minwuia thermotolerans]|uniref:Anti-sigma factor n=1 Tax=Minwuia thermotolerans TaxID=2056226 RepID=A0A2M9G2G5_9PROT|nr:anti-sigma factor [Minwuia thermotolerans]PJK29911.1 hypothetical protein CVT23_09070 [Minwuia thermotolerans]
MTDDTCSIGELDLLAYADGRLSRDPERRAAVERYLSDRPHLAERVAAFAQQDSAIRTAFDPVLGEPVPERLRAVVERPARRPSPVRTGLLAASLLLAALLGGAAGGWMLAQDGSDGTARAAFVDSVSEHAGDAGLALSGGAVISAAGGDEPIDWLSQQISIGVTVPDLAPLGFRLVEKTLVDDRDRPMVRLVFADADERHLTVFLRPRWREDAQDVHTISSEGMTISHWAQGPVVYGVTAAGSGADSVVARVTDRLRRAFGSDERTAPVVDPAPLQPPAEQLKVQNDLDGARPLSFGKDGGGKLRETSPVIRPEPAISVN